MPRDEKMEAGVHLCRPTHCRRDFNEAGLVHGHCNKCWQPRNMDVRSGRRNVVLESVAIVVRRLVEGKDPKGKGQERRMKRKGAKNLGRGEIMQAREKK